MTGCVVKFQDIRFLSRAWNATSLPIPPEAANARLFATARRPAGGSGALADEGRHCPRDHGVIVNCGNLVFNAIRMQLDAPAPATIAYMTKNSA